MVLLVLLSACGTKAPDEIIINLSCGGGSCAALFQNSNLADIVISLTATSSTTVLVYPQDCVNGQPADCGFEPSETEFRLDPEPIAKGTEVVLQIMGRDSLGLTIFSGTSDPFANNPPSAPITINVQPSS
jgi:hypothetical protein